MSSQLFEFLSAPSTTAGSFSSGETSSESATSKITHGPERRDLGEVRSSSRAIFTAAGENAM